MWGNVAAGVIGSLLTTLALWLFGAIGSKVSLTMPPNAVVAFNSDKCPENGWDPFVAGHGRYIVGLQDGGKLAEPVGEKLSNEEKRQTGPHFHTTTDSTIGNSGTTLILEKNGIQAVGE